jgi:hypothetical protein
MTEIPDQFDETFLEWFRARTEEAWASYPEYTVERFLADEPDGFDHLTWRRGTRWTNALTDDHIAEVERHQRISFPPDLRLFLQRLHTVAPPMVCFGLSTG